MSSPNSRAVLSRILFPIFGLLVLSGPVSANADSGNAATASLAARHATVMEQGLNHEDAYVATEATAGSIEAASPAAEHAAAMDRGLNHEDARTATYKSVDLAASPAARHAAAMERGLSHEDAYLTTYAK
jgi:hypothetical protein